MGRFREKLYRFMYGRYGVDKLYYFMLISVFVLWVVELIVVTILPKGMSSNIVQAVFSTVNAVIIALMVLRSMSRNIYKRRRENEIYLKVSRFVVRFFKGNTSRSTKSNNVDSECFIFRDCTKCGATLRLPKKKGRNKVKCPRCSHSFFVKAK